MKLTDQMYDRQVAIEEQRKLELCLHCGVRTTKIVRMIGNNETKNYCRVCTNPNCLAFIDILKVDTWRIARS